MPLWLKCSYFCKHIISLNQFAQRLYQQLEQVSARLGSKRFSLYSKVPGDIKMQEGQKMQFPLFKIKQKTDCQVVRLFVPEDFVKLVTAVHCNSKIQKHYQAYMYTYLYQCLDKIKIKKWPASEKCIFQYYTLIGLQHKQTLKTFFLDSLFS